MAKKGTYVVADNVVTPLGYSTAAVLQEITAGNTGVQVNEGQQFRDQPVCASLFSAGQWSEIEAATAPGFTQFEQLLLFSVQQAMQQANIDLSDDRTLLLIASTKGNIGLLEAGSDDPEGTTALYLSAAKVGTQLKYHSTPIVVSNACISGMTALLVAKRLMESGHYDHAVVTGADVISPFIVAGFRSFQALSDEVCQPFDQHRKGINLGEAAATIILSVNPSGIRLSGGSSSSDANHISGPSRTGAEMAQAIRAALQSSAVDAREIGFVSAHGTATPFNDEMEAKAFMLAGLNESPVFSLKAYFGHTLGAAGLLESAVSIEAMRRDTIIASKGYSTHGVSQPVKVSNSTTHSEGIKHILKTGSGFGGCNAALVFSKAG